MGDFGICDFSTRLPLQVHIYFHERAKDTAIWNDAQRISINSRSIEAFILYVKNEPDIANIERVPMQTCFSIFLERSIDNETACRDNQK